MDEQFILEKEVDNLDAKRAVIENWVAQINSGRIDRQKEVATQADFLNKIFGDVLGYTYDTHDKWLLHKEVSTPIGGKSADGALGFFRMIDGEKNLSDVRVAIELKDARTHLDKAQNRQGDKRTPVEQGFDYANKFGENCKWLIVSNFKEIRLYNKSLGPTRYESWQLTDLNDHETEDETDAPNLFKNSENTEKPNELQRFFFLLKNGRLFWEKGTSDIDNLLKERQEEELRISQDFYKEYKRHRKGLFDHLKKFNPQIEDLTLLEKTQKLLDRIIFVCFCEDYDIIPMKTFHRLIEYTRSNIFDPSDSLFYENVKHLFQNVNDGHRKSRINRFNGGLFADDPILNELIIKDDCLEDIILMSRYDFATDMNVNILGHIFEQSISDIEVFKAQITGKTPDNQGKRKEDGIFYTPEYITRYIVEQAVGGWLNERKIELGEADLPDLEDKDYDSLESGGNERIQAHIRFWQQYAEALRNVKVIDPACGSGAFLNQVFDFLLKEHQILRNELDKLSLESDPTPLDKYILTNNIYGVDLNHESVQITKLSLWLKTANKYSELTALDQNILIGNSLIDDPKIAGDLAFKWKKRFKSIFDNGGFDIVVGNPPYVRQELLGDIKPHLEKHYESFVGTADLFTYFYEKGISILHPKGILSYITNDFNKTTSSTLLRKYLTEKTNFIAFSDFSEVDVFKGTTTYPVILTLGLAAPSEFLYCKFQQDDIDDIQTVFDSNSYPVVQKTLDAANWRFKSNGVAALFSKITKNPNIKELVGKCYYGIKAGLNEAFITVENYKLSEHVKRIFEGKDLKKWNIPKSEKKLIIFKSNSTKNQFGDLDESQAFEKMIAKYPELMSHLSNFETKAKKRHDKGDYWWELRKCAYYEMFEKPKIVFPNLQNSNKFTYDDSGAYINNPAVILPTNDKALLGILNSKLVWYFLHQICVVRSGGYIEVKPQYFEQIPIADYSKIKNKISKKVNFQIEKTSTIQSKVANFHNRLRDNLNIEKLSKKLSRFWEYDFKVFLAELKKHKITLSLVQQDEWAAYFDQYKTDIQALQTEIDRTDAEIDRMVYTLYGLTDEEIKIVEES